MQKNILVTGGAGFIASHLIDSLLKDGHNITAIDNFNDYYDPELKRKNIAHNLKNPDLKIIEGDINDNSALKEAMKDTEIIYHLASQPGITTSVDNPLKTNENNINATLNILNEIRKNGIEKIIFESSSSIYGNAKIPFNDKERKMPISPYGVSKLACEHYLRVFSEIYGIRYTTIRPFTVYGPRMRPDLAISIFTKNALQNKPIEIFGDGSQTRDFTHVENIIDANIKAMTKGDGMTFDIGAGKAYTVNQLIEKILTITGSSSEIIRKEKRIGDNPDTLADTTDAKNILGWQPKYTLDEGLKNYIEWFKNEYNN